MQGVECKINLHLKRCLGIPPDFKSGRLYIRLQLLLDFQIAKCRMTMSFRDSRDNKVKKAGKLGQNGSTVGDFS